MTVPSQTNRDQQSGNGVTTAFTVPFRILDQTHLRVLLTVDGVTTEQTLTTHYTVSGVGGASTTVTFVSAPASGSTITFLRNVPLTQETDYVPNDPFPAESHEQALDKLTMIAQQLAEEIDRSLRLPIDSTASAELPTLEPLAPLVVNADGTGFEMGSTALTGDMLLRPDLASEDSTKGSSLVRFLQAGTGAVARTVQDKLRGAVDVKDFGAVGDGVTDDAAAIQAAITAAGSRGVHFPAGLYLCGAKITSTNSDFVITGDGAGVSEIRFTATDPAQQGFSVTLNEGADYFRVQGLTLSTTTGYAAGKTALSIDGTAMLTGTYPSRTISDRSSRRGLITDVTVKGISASTGWDVGVRATSVGWFSIDHFSYWGEDDEGSSTGDWQGTGIRIDGEGTPVEIKMSNIWLYSAYYGVFCPDYVEGVYLSDFDFVNVRYGFYAQYVAGVSVLPEANCGCLQPTIGPGHIKAFLGGVSIRNVNQATLARLNIYMASQPAYTGYSGIYLRDGGNNYVYGCSITDTGTSTNPSYGVVFDNIDRSFIEKVGTYSLTTAGIDLRNDSDDNVVCNCYVNGSTSIANTDGTSAGNWFAKNRLSTGGGTTYGGSVSSNSYMERRAYAVNTVVTLTGGATAETVNIAIPAGVFSAKPTVIVANAESSSQYIVCTPVQQSASTTATNMQIQLFRNDGAALIGGSVRLHVVAYE